MPFIEVKCLLKSPSTKALEKITARVKEALQIPSTSRMRLVWNTLKTKDIIGMGRVKKDASVVVLFYTRNSYERAKIRKAMRELYEGVVAVAGAAAHDVLVFHIPIAPGELLSSNGFWDGGDNFR